MEKREPSCNVGGSINWNSQYGEKYRVKKKKKKKLKIEQPYNPAIPLLRKP